MRITKVKNSKDSPLIEIHRTTEGGELKCSPETYAVQQELEEIINMRQEDFIQSLLYKTILGSAPKIPKSNQDEKLDVFYKDCYNEIKLIIESALNGACYKPKKVLSKSPTEIEIKKCFTSKWRKHFKFQDKDGRQISIHLANAIALCLKNPRSSLQILEHYIKWANQFKERKIKNLARSVAANSTQNAAMDVPSSSRKEALKLWAEELILKHQIDLKSYKKSFKIKEFSDALFNLIDNKQKQLKNDNEELNRAKRAKNESLAASLRNKIRETKFRIEELVKQVYRSHCHKLHLERTERGEIETVQERQFRLEVAKHLERHYPIKKQNPHKKQKKQEGKKQEFGSAKDDHVNLSEKIISDRVMRQIKNATLQYIIHTGKQFYYEEDQYNSEQLMLIRAKENLALRFIDAAAFASNNVRIALNPLEEKDILNKEPFCDSLTGLDDTGQLAAWDRIRQFFNLSIVSDSENILQEMDACNSLDFVQSITPLRGAISNIRNSVVHFKGNIIKNIFDKLDFEQFSKLPEKVERQGKYGETYFSYKTGSYNPLFTETRYKDLLAAEIDVLPELQREQLRSSRLLEFYNPAALAALFTEQGLVSRNFAFTPSFHRIFTLGRRLQHEADNSYSTHYYFEHDPANDDACLAQRNLLRLVYETLFIPNFVEDKIAFSKVVQTVLAINKAQAGTNAAVAFEQVPQYDSNMQSPKQYLAQIQSRLTQEELLKRDSGKLSRQSTGNFQRFLFYIFMKGFDQFLVNESTRFAFIQNPQRRHMLPHASPEVSCQQKIEDDLNRIQLPKARHRIDVNNPAHVSFWIFAKLLSQQQINELSNQILKYRLFEKKLVQAYPSLQEDNKDSYSVLLDILALCRLSCEKYFSHSTEKQLEQLAHYVDAERLTKAPYMQSDGETPVLFASIQLAHRYATDSILIPLLKDDFKVSASDITQREQQRDKIADLTKTRQSLHRELVNKNFDGSQKNQYEKLQTSIEDYNWLDNKVKLFHIQKLHHLIIEILGRFAAYINLYERNLRFCYTYIRREFPADSKNGYKELNWDRGMPTMSKDKAGKMWIGFFYEVFAPFKGKLEGKDMPENIQSKIRNYIAHFNYLGNPRFSLVKTMADLRRLMQHDRKLQNAVTTSIVNILERNGIIVQFDSGELHRHNPVIHSCVPKTIMHLKCIEIDCVNSEFAQMVRKLLEFDTQDEKP